MHAGNGSIATTWYCDEGVDAMNELEKVKEVTGIQDLSSINEDEALVILGAVETKQLSQENIKALIEFSPHFVTVAAAALETLKTISTSAKESQVAAVTNIGEVSKQLSAALSSISKEAMGDAARIELARSSERIAQTILETAKVNAGMNKDNNNLWKFCVGGALVVTACAAVVIGGVIVVKKA